MRAAAARTIQLQPDAARPGTFIARLDDLQIAGVYTFTATLKATTPAGQAYQLAPQAVSFSRVADPYWVSMRWAIRIAALLALIGLIALLGYLLFLITGPFPRGTLVLEQRRADPLAEIGDWDQLTAIRMSSQRLLFGLFRTRRPKRERRGAEIDEPARDQDPARGARQGRGRAGHARSAPVARARCRSSSSGTKSRRPSTASIGSRMRHMGWGRKGR